MGKAGVGGASGVPPFLLFPFGAFRSAPSGKGRSLGAPREPSRAGGLGRGRQVSPSRAGCAGAGAGRGRFGGRPFGAAGGCRGGGAFRPFPLRHGQFRSFRPEKPGLNGDVSASFRRTTGDQTATASSPFRHKVRRFVAFCGRGLFLPYNARRGPGRGPFAPPPGAATSPLRRGEVRRFAVRKSPARPFTASPWRSPTKPPGFPTSPWRSSPLRRAKVHHPARFFASPC